MEKAREEMLDRLRDIWRQLELENDSLRAEVERLRLKVHRVEIELAYERSTAIAGCEGVV